MTNGSPIRHSVAQTFPILEGVFHFFLHFLQFLNLAAVFFDMPQDDFANRRARRFAVFRLFENICNFGERKAEIFRGDDKFQTRGV